VSAAGERPARAFVTGASRGIGRAVALALAADRFDVAVGYAQRAEAAAAVCAEI
jgi:3-oxoacyl-[acyl-carrier protein] reductase